MTIRTLMENAADAIASQSSTFRNLDRDIAHQGIKSIAEANLKAFGEQIKRTATQEGFREGTRAGIAQAERNNAGRLSVSKTAAFLACATVAAISSYATSAFFANCYC